MSRKPQIKLSYPDASELAMMLTDAMIRRAPGKRVVETTSEDKSNTDEGGSLLDRLDSVRTSTGVEMTLTLDPNSMDYALQQLIRPNLTEEERKRIFGESSAGGNDIFSPHAGEAAGAGTCTDAVDSACRAADGQQTQSGEQEKMVEVGKISDNKLRDILADMTERLDHENAIEVIEDTIKEIDHCAGVIDLDETAEAGYSYKTYALFGLILATIELLKPTKRDSPANTLLHYLTLTKEHLEKNSKDAEADFLHALHIGWTSAYNQPQMLENARGLVDRITERLYNEDHPKPDTASGDDTVGSAPLADDKADKSDTAEPSWDDVEKEALSLGRNKTDKTDKTNNADPEIEPGLLDDIDEADASTAAVGSASLADKEDKAQ